MVELAHVSAADSVGEVLMGERGEEVPAHRKWLTEWMAGVRSMVRRVRVEASGRKKVFSKCVKNFAPTSSPGWNIL